MAEVLFLILAVCATLTASMVVVAKNPLYGALSLVLSFFFIAGIYVLLIAHMMAALQVLVYAGAIMVLFIFVIMLLNLSKEELGGQTKSLAMGAGAIAVGAIIVKTITVVVDAAPSITPGSPLPANFGTVDAMGDMLFRQFLFPFELTGILLLVAVIGAVVLAKKTL